MGVFLLGARLLFGHGNLNTFLLPICRHLFEVVSGLVVEVK